MTYRDETETLRAELDRVRAELATLKSKPREVETLQWRDVYGAAAWVSATVMALVVVALGCGVVSFVLAESSYTALSILLAVVACASAALAGYIWWRSLPRVKVIR